MDTWVYLVGAGVAFGAGLFAWYATVPVTPSDLAASLEVSRVRVDAFIEAKPSLPFSLRVPAQEMVDALSEYFATAEDLATNTENRQQGVKLMSDLYELFVLPAADTMDSELFNFPDGFMSRAYEWLDGFDAVVLGVTRMAALAINGPEAWDGTLWAVFAAGAGVGFLLAGLHRWLHPPTPPLPLPELPVDPGPWLGATSSVPAEWWWVAGVVAVAALAWAAWWDLRRPPRK